MGHALWPRLNWLSTRAACVVRTRTRANWRCGGERWLPWHLIRPLHFLAAASVPDCCSWLWLCSSVIGNPLGLTTVVPILKPYSHMPITVCITQYHITCEQYVQYYNIREPHRLSVLRWSGHKYAKCLSKHPASFFQGFYDQQYCYTCQKVSWTIAKHKKCGNKSVISLLSITLIHPCIFFTTVAFDNLS